MDEIKQELFIFVDLYIESTYLSKIFNFVF